MNVDKLHTESWTDLKRGPTPQWALAEPLKGFKTHERPSSSIKKNTQSHKQLNQPNNFLFNYETDPPSGRVTNIQGWDGMFLPRYSN